MVCSYFRIVRNRASDSARKMDGNGSPVSGDGNSNHGSPNGHHGGAYSINAIMSTLPQGTPPLGEHNGNAGTKRKHEDGGKCYTQQFTW